MKKLSISGKLLLMVLPLEILCIVIVVVFSCLNNYVSKSSQELYYAQLYEGNSTLINADRDFYQAYTALLKSLSSNRMDVDIPAEIQDYRENVQQTRDRVDAVAEIVMAYPDMMNYTYNGYQFATEYENFKTNIDAMYAAYDSENKSGSLTLFGQRFDATRENLANMEDLIEDYAINAQQELHDKNYIYSGAMIFVSVIALATVGIFCIFVIRYIRRNIIKVTKGINAVANKDLSVEITEIQGKDEIAQLSRAVGTLKKQLLGMMEILQQSSYGLNESSNLMVKNTDASSESMNSIDVAASELATTASKQAEDILNIANEISSIEKIVNECQSRTDNLAKTCEKIENSTSTGMNTVKELMAVTEQNSAAFEKIFAVLEGVEKNTGTIGQASEMIANIADQTSLLSLNASIEAARAGEAGRGFAVVADEIRQLADQSADSVNTINSMIAELVKSVNEATAVSEQVREYVKQQGVSVNNTKAGFAEIVDGTVVVNTDVGALNEVNVKLGESVDTIQNLVEALSAASEENAATAEELSATTATVASSIMDLAETGKSINGSSDELNSIVTEYIV